MPGTKRAFISDVHISAGRSLGRDGGRHVYDWLGSGEIERFGGFLGYLNAQASAGELNEVVFIGDLFDNWVVPVDEIPPGFPDIVEAPCNGRILERLSELANNKVLKLIYLPGNHDMGMSERVFRSVFPEARFPRFVYGGSAQFHSAFSAGRVHAEHGSSYALFNAPDPANSPSRTPLGYFISRIVATRARDTGETERHYWTYADDILELCGPEKVAQSLFDAVLEEAGLNENVRIRMPDRGGTGTFVTAAEVKARYANVYQQWQEQRGRGAAFKAMMAEIGYLGDWADHLCKKGGPRVVIFGHSHDAGLDKDSWFVDDRVYANCGSWCEGKKPCTWVETVTDKKKREIEVTVMDWNGGKPKVKDGPVTAGI